MVDITHIFQGCLIAGKGQLYHCHSDKIDPISSRITVIELGQSYDCTKTSEAIKRLPHCLWNNCEMGKLTVRILYACLCNQNKTKHNNPCAYFAWCTAYLLIFHRCIFFEGTVCTSGFTISLLFFITWFYRNALAVCVYCIKIFLFQIKTQE